MHLSWCSDHAWFKLAFKDKILLLSCQVLKSIWAETHKLNQVFTIVDIGLLGRVQEQGSVSRLST